MAWSGKTYQKAKAVVANGSPGLVEAANKNEVSIEAAVAVTRP